MSSEFKKLYELDSIYDLKKASLLHVSDNGVDYKINFEWLVRGVDLLSTAGGGGTDAETIRNIPVIVSEISDGEVLVYNATTQIFENRPMAVVPVEPDPGAEPYGILWDTQTDTYLRTGSADYTQAQAKMRRCLVNTNGSVNYYLHGMDSTFKVDGTSGSNLTGADGNVMVEIPKFYVKYTTIGNNRSIEINTAPTVGFTVHPAFMKAGVEVPYRYYRAYQGSKVGSKIMSIAGATPTMYTDITAARVDAVANGTGWHLTDWNLINAVRTLMVVELGTLKTNSVLGNGATVNVTTGQSNSYGNRSSNILDTGFMSYRGIENFYSGAENEIIDGININENGKVFTNSNYTTFAKDVYTGNYIDTGITLPTSTGYIKNMHISNKGFIPTEVGGSSASYVTDEYSYASTQSFSGTSGITF